MLLVLRLNDQDCGLLSKNVKALIFFICDGCSLSYDKYCFLLVDHLFSQFFILENNKCFALFSFFLTTSKTTSALHLYKTLLIYKIAPL